MDGADDQVETRFCDDLLSGGEILRGVAYLDAETQEDAVAPGGFGLSMGFTSGGPIVGGDEMPLLVHHVVVIGEAEGGKSCLDRCGGHVRAGTVAVKGYAGVHMLVCVKHGKNLQSKSRLISPL